jgi:hypothetical protein
LRNMQQLWVNLLAGPHPVVLLYFKYFKFVLSQCYCTWSAYSVSCTVLELSPSAQDLLSIVLEVRVQSCALYLKKRVQHCTECGAARLLLDGNRILRKPQLYKRRKSPRT